MFGIIPEILGHGQRRVTHSESRAGRFIHLAEYEDHRIENAGLLHFPVDFLPLSATFPNAAEEAHPASLLDSVVDYFHDEDGFAHPSPAEQACFPPSFQGAQDIDDLDARFQDLGSGSLTAQGYGLRVNRPPFSAADRLFPIDGLSENVENPAQ